MRSISLASSLSGSSESTSFLRWSIRKRWVRLTLSRRVQLLSRNARISGLLSDDDTVSDILRSEWRPIADSCAVSINRALMSAEAARSARCLKSSICGSASTIAWRNSMTSMPCGRAEYCAGTRNVVRGTSRCMRHHSVAVDRCAGRPRRPTSWRGWLRASGRRRAFPGSSGVADPSERALLAVVDVECHPLERRLLLQHVDEGCCDLVGWFVNEQASIELEEERCLAKPPLIGVARQAAGTHREDDEERHAHEHGGLRQCQEARGAQPDLTDVDQTRHDREEEGHLDVTRQRAGEHAENEQGPGSWCRMHRRDTPRPRPGSDRAGMYRSRRGVGAVPRT